MCQDTSFQHYFMFQDTSVQADGTDVYAGGYGAFPLDKDH